jgi:sulfonate transport system substrate-binding protein
MSPAEGMAEFTRGTIDAWGIFDMYYAMAEKLKVGTLASGNSTTYFFATTDFAAKHADLLGKLNDLLAKEFAWAGAHRDEATSILHEATSVDLEVLRTMMKRIDFVVTPMTDDVIANQQTEADRFLKFGLIAKPIKVREMVWKWAPSSS